MPRDKKEIKILISPAHYYFSDKFGSEPGYAYSLVKYIGDKLPKLDVIVGSSDIIEPLPKNIKLITIFKARSKNPAVELLKYIFFYPLVCLKYLQLQTKYDVVHHMFPTSPKTVDPLLILVKLISPKTKIIIGPLQLLSELNSPEDLSVMLVGKQHKSLLTSLLPYLYTFLTVIMTPFAYVTFRTADTIVCNFHIIRKYYLGKYNKPIYIIPTGVDPIKGNKLKKETTKYVTIICVGKLQHHKGQKYLLEAFQMLFKKSHNTKLILLGDGNLRKSYEKFVNKYKMQKYVNFVGHIPRNEVVKWYAKADIFCLPSLIDTNPVVVQEAMSLGIPIVASNVGAVSEIVDKSGLIVDKANSMALYVALNKLVEDKKLREEMGNVGYDRIKKYYTWDTIAKQWINLYESIIK